MLHRDRNIEYFFFNEMLIGILKIASGSENMTMYFNSHFLLVSGDINMQGGGVCGLAIGAELWY